MGICFFFMSLPRVVRAGGRESGERVFWLVCLFFCFCFSSLTPLCIFLSHTHEHTTPLLSLCSALTPPPMASNDTDAAALAARAAAHGVRGDWVAAVDDARRAVEADGKCAEAHLQRG